MPETDLLTVVAAMGTQSGPWLPLDRERLGTLLLCSFPVVVFALLPLGLFAALVDPEHAWQISSACYLAVLVYGLLRARHLFRLAREHPGPKSRPLGFVLVCIQAIAALLLIANAATLAQAWPHLAALGLGLCVAFIIFVELLLLSLRDE